MSNYIKRDDAIDILNEFIEEAGNRGDTEVEGTCMLARNEIIDLPSIEIVRCKECKWAGRDEHCPAIEVYMICGDDGYCSYGERETDETD